MKEHLDTLHGSILLKANNRVNRSANAACGSPDGGFGASTHTIRDNSVMCVKDYVHFSLPR